jgi:hypothetical protein
MSPAPESFRSRDERQDTLTITTNGIHYRRKARTSVFKLREAPAALGGQPGSIMNLIGPDVQPPISVRAERSLRQQAKSKHRSGRPFDSGPTGLRSGRTVID